MYVDIKLLPQSWKHTILYRCYNFPSLEQDALEEAKICSLCSK